MQFWNIARIQSHVAASLLLSVATCAWSAPVQTLAYFQPADQASNFAELVTLMRSGRTHVISAYGTTDGLVTDNGTQKLVTFDAPLRSIYYAGYVDGCGVQPQIQHDVNQQVLRRVAGTTGAGTSQVVDIGTDTVLDGCDAGLVTPFGSVDDAGTTVSHLDMARRSPMTDLVTGVQLAGLTDAYPQAPDVFLPVDLATLTAPGQVRFESSGVVRSSVTTADGWMVIQGDGFQRGYTRLNVDSRTGGELWLTGVFSAGAPLSVSTAWVVKPTAGATFGDVKSASREWESGMFAGSRTLVYYDLYQSLKGKRIINDLDTGVVSRSALKWSLSGSDIISTRRVSVGSAVRTWHPIATSGKNHFVFESEVVNSDDGGSYTSIERRINMYIDNGKAVPAAMQPRAVAGSLNLLRRPQASLSRSRAW